MHIVVACGAMPFGPNTPRVRSLGGSETAALELSQALGERGHEVHLFCNLPQRGQPDYMADGTADPDTGVVFHDLSGYGRYVNSVEHDLTIGLRDPQFMAMFCKSKKKVLWAHDIFTKRGMQRMLDQMGWTFDEIWAVSEWHRQQIHEATGYPLDHIVALRNGVVRYDDVETIDRSAKHLIYAARPERGLDNLIRPGGVMDNLPDYTLTVAMYEHFPEHMRGYYEQIFRRMKEMPNVEFVGGKSNHELRQMIADSAAYIYPTQFEETSCILARECIEQATPFLTTRVGALPETLGDSGLYFEDWLSANGISDPPSQGTPGWCKLFSYFFRETMNSPAILKNETLAMEMRNDLYWDGVAEMVEEHAVPLGPIVQTCAAAIIAMNNEETMLQCLNSLVGNVDEVHIALGPCTDGTVKVIVGWAEKHPDVPVFLKAVPKIEARVFGFDDARNASAEDIKTDWVLWIDTDEYLVGNIRQYLRNNHLQAYLISQHHFTVEPRGNPAMIDRPARLFRNNVGYKALGHIHEHFECPEGGPGRAYLCPDVDIAHTGYKDEKTRHTRFERNFPFLEWEHEEKQQRKLNYFLWFRDIVHRMRIAFNNQDQEGGVKLAHEAESYYNEHYNEMGAFGPGIFQSLAYMAEVNKVLGKGVPMRLKIQIGEQASGFDGVFDNYDQMERVLKQIVEPEFEERKSRYY